MRGHYTRKAPLRDRAVAYIAEAGAKGRQLRDIRAHMDGAYCNVVAWEASGHIVSGGPRMRKRYFIEAWQRDVYLATLVEEAKAEAARIAAMKQAAADSRRQAQEARKQAKQATYTAAAWNGSLPPKTPPKAKGKGKAWDEAKAVTPPHVKVQGLPGFRGDRWGADLTASKTWARRP